MEPWQPQKALTTEDSGRYAAKILTAMQNLTAGAVGVAFCFYAVGFVIMNSFLGKYGVRAGAVFTFDYIAAALCYMIYIGAVAGPLWILYYAMIRPHTLGSPAKWVWATLIVWNALLLTFRRLYFPGGEVSRSWSDVQFAVTVIGIAHWIFKKVLTKKNPPWAKRLLPILKHELVLPSYLVVFGLIGVIGEKNASGLFIFNAFLLFGSTVILGGTSTPVWDLKEHLGRWEIQGMLAILYVCIVLVNASEFGQEQYGSLPAIVGGGHPTTIMIKTSIATDENGKRTSLPIADGMIGPVLLLYQSASEVCVISEGDYSKRTGDAVQLKRDLIDWIVTKRPNKEGKPTPTPAPKTTASPSVSPTAFENVAPSPSPTPER